MGNRLDDEDVIDLSKTQHASTGGNEYLIFYVRDGLSKISRAAPVLPDSLISQNSAKFKSAFTATTISEHSSSGKHTMIILAAPQEQHIMNGGIVLPKKKLVTNSENLIVIDQHLLPNADYLSVFPFQGVHVYER